MKVVYSKWHNNYDELVLGQEYNAQYYKKGWLLIDTVLYREDCFQIVNNLNNAISIAATMHNGQVDKGGNPYILHPLRIMMKMQSNEEQIVAVLHDILEDTTMTEEKLSEDFTSQIIDAVIALTRQENESYMDFIRRCKQNELARKVKIADIEDNMDLSRIEQPTKKDYERIKKYEKALKELMRIEE
ncbi:HD domain-containing protein [Paenibacillus sp. FSL M7-0802]|uniref:HD domain-containing protein n=1 Tax=Paenibacillus sp. FSL M7-0802 TaxID=2921536 RepID=UPI0030F5A7A6